MEEKNPMLVKESLEANARESLLNATTKRKKL
jgi:hypothetical protein